MKAVADRSDHAEAMHVTGIRVQHDETPSSRLTLGSSGSGSKVLEERAFWLEEL